MVNGILGDKADHNERDEENDDHNAENSPAQPV
jgi:hypothetical protein